jgi:hypothetical protein
MAFWTSAASEPKRQHRFILRLPGLQSTSTGNYAEYLCKSVTKPSYSISETPHKFLGNTYYFPGTVTWNTVSAVIINSIDPDGNALLYEALINSGYLLPDVQASKVTDAGTVSAGISTVNKAQALSALGSVEIEELTGQGQVVSIWTLKNPFITEAKFGDLDYSGDDMLNLEVTFRYDWAQYQVGEGYELVKAQNA